MHLISFLCTLLFSFSAFVTVHTRAISASSYEDGTSVGLLNQTSENELNLNDPYWLAVFKAEEIAKSKNPSSRIVSVNYRQIENGQHIEVIFSAFTDKAVNLIMKHDQSTGQQLDTWTEPEVLPPDYPLPQPTLPYYQWRDVVVGFLKAYFLMLRAGCRQHGSTRGAYRLNQVFRGPNGKPPGDLDLWYHMSDPYEMRFESVMVNAQTGAVLPGPPVIPPQSS